MKHAKSNTKLKMQTRRKTNPILTETIFVARNNPGWRKLAEILSSSTRSQSAVNLKQIDNKTTEGDTVLIAGKVISQGDLTKKVRICALSISEQAREKLKQTKSEFVTILEEIKTNKKAEGV